MTESVLGARSHVCAVIVGRIGDTLLVTPALRALRAVCGRLTVLAHPQRIDVLRHLDCIDDLRAITKRSGWWRSWLDRGRYDAAFLWGREAALLGYCLRSARRTVAFAYPEFGGIASAALLRVPVPRDSSMHAVRERLLLTEAAGVADSGLQLDYAVSDAERQSAQDWLSRRAPPGATPLVGFQPFSFPTKAHRDWPVESFAELALRLCERFPRAHCIVLGDDSARRRAAPLAERLPGRITVAAGGLALRDSAALMQRLDLYVGVDTGPTHIAGALGIPMVALYHPRYPAQNLVPLDRPRCTVIEASGEDMAAIAVETVCAAAIEQLDAHARIPSER